jgi:hypothetical protein
VRPAWLSAIVLTAAAATARADDGAEAAPGDAAEPAPAPVTAPTDGKHAIRGVLVSKRDGTPLAGATVVASATGGGATGESVVITEDDGRYEIRVAPGVYDLIAYYIDGSTTIASRIAVDADVRFGPTALEEVREIGCVFYWHDPSLDSMPRFGLTVTRRRTVVARDRTHRAWIAPVVAADARTAVTTLESAERLAGAPGLPLVFVEEVLTHTLRVPIELPAGTGGAADVSVRHGSNTQRGEARLLVGLERPHGAAGGAADAAGASVAGSGGLEILASGPMKEDRAWFAAALAADRDARDAIGAHGMIALNVAPSLDHQLGVVGIAQALGDGGRDGWTSAHWVSKLWDYRLELHAIATAEHLAAPRTDAIARATGGDGGDGGELDVTDRLGGRLAAKWRKRAHGYHRVELAAGGGTGTHDRARIADTSFTAGDVWQVRPNLELAAGVRAETRVFDAARATVIAPRAHLSYDFTREGRADVFLAYQRVPHLDDGPPGAWRAAGARLHDELAAGVSYIPSARDYLTAGIAARARRTPAAGGGDIPTAPAAAPSREAPALGAEAWIHIDRRRTQLHAAATTLDRAASILAQRTLIDRSSDDLFAGVTAHATPAGTDGGASLRWQHTGSRGSHGDRARFDLDVGLELFAGTSGPSGRLVAGAAW